jgi:sulfatase modifying factor 1
MTNPATVSDFRLDLYEVTVGRFRQFVNAGMGTQQNPPPAGAGGRTLGGAANQGGWQATWNGSLTANSTALTAALGCGTQGATWTSAPGANENLPINCATWYEAMAFCVWDGGFLPTEAEWNYAAAGGNEQRAFPWSVPASSLLLDCSYANFLYYTNFCVLPLLGSVNRVGSESPKGDGKWGQADLAGNVFEWTLDWDAAYTNPCTDCADLTPSAMRSLRGGDFGDPAINERTAYRGNVGTPNIRDSGVGLRCARP